jgi:hypothetical protein
MAFRTKNPEDPKVLAWNRIEHDIRRVRDERVFAVRHHDIAQREYCDQEIARLRKIQIEDFSS